MSDNDLELMMQKADQFLDIGDFSSALLVYSKIIEIDPDNDEAYAMMGSVQGETGDVNLALSSLNKALALNQKNADAWLMLGMIQQSTGNKKTALESLENAAKYANDYDVAHYTLAKLLLEMGNTTRAIISLENTVACSNGHIDAWLALATTHQSENNHNAALNCFKKVLEIQPNHHDALKWIPIEKIALDDFDGAEQSILNAIHIYPDETWQYKTMSHIRVAEGRITEAVELAELAMISTPKNIVLQLYYADLLEKKGDYDKVLECLRPMLESQPPNFDAVILLAKFSAFIGMKDQTYQLIGYLRSIGNMTPLQLSTIDAAEDWLRSQA